VVYDGEQHYRGIPQLIHTWRTADGWQRHPHILSEDRYDGPGDHFPSCEFTRCGALRCAWMQESDIPELYPYHVMFAELRRGQWQGVSVSVPDSFDDVGPSLTNDASGQVYVIYTSRRPSYSVVYGRNRRPRIGDVGTDRILSPTSSYLMPSGPIQSQAIVRNYGDSYEGPFNVKLTVSPGDYTSTRRASRLAPGDSCTVAFDPYTALATGVYSTRCSTMLTGDVDPGNDALTASLQGCTFIDFFDLTDGGLIPDPDTCWARGVPQSPWTLPPMDSVVWGDRLSGYHGGNENSMLTSPTYVALQDNPVVAFQHNFDTSIGEEGYAEAGGIFYYSTDSDSSWALLMPCAGLEYSGEFWPDTLCWCGWESGWNQSVFTIPVDSGGEFRVRWRFASVQYPFSGRGWLIDEVAGIGCDTAPLADRPPQDENSIIAALDFSPNPVHGSGRVSYTLLKDCNVGIKLYDAAGRLAARPATSGFKKGVNTAALDATGLERGIYFLTLAGAGDSKTTKVIVE